MYRWLFNILLSPSQIRKYLLHSTPIRLNSANILLLFSVRRTKFRTLHVQSKFSTSELWYQLPLFFGLVSILTITGDEVKKKRQKKITLLLFIDFGHVVFVKRLRIDIFIDLSANSGRSTMAATPSRCLKVSSPAPLRFLPQIAHSFLLVINVKEDEG